MVLRPCVKCGRPSEKFSLHCQICGHTRWWVIALSLFVGLISLLFGVAAFVSLPADFPPADRTKFNLVAGLFVLVGLAFLWLPLVSIKDSVKGRKTKKGTGPVQGADFFSGEARAKRSEARVYTEPEAPDSECYICGKAVHEGPNIEVVSIPVSGEADPWAAVQGSVDKIFSLKIVCVSCHRVFCRECGGEDCLEMGPDEALCPKCAHR